MLSYRHGFHVGNAADVLKHSVLVFCLEYLLGKEKPLLCVDTHAGAGIYSLHEGFAAQKREWEKGVGKLRLEILHEGKAALKGPGSAALLRRYLELCSRDESGSGPAVYPGSPAIMARLLRPLDRLVCFELHPSDYAACKLALAGSGEVRQADGLTSLKSLLPPPSRRGLILIDPPYEVKEDYLRLPISVEQALRRFSSGTYIIWYPLLRESPAVDFPERLMNLYQGNRCRLELYTADPGAGAANSPRGMYGSGMVIYNPPWTLAPALEESLPIMGEAIGKGKNDWKLEHYQC